VPEDKAEEICLKFGYELEVDRRHKEEHDIHRDFVGTDDDDDDEQSLIDRAPVVTFLGHVDHGKTSLQDRVRQTSVVDGEAGKITQHIGASTVTFKDKMITFIDTPGHAAFTKMRARGANVTDIAILVVAADDGFMPQTIEAMNHARAANVPIIVAINKMDLPAADPDKIILQMQQNELMSEDWGGDVGTVRVSAETGEGIDDLLDRILLETELLELKGNPNRRAKGVVIEANLEQGLGATANILVQNGTLRIGDMVLCGEYYGKVRAMFDFNDNKIDEAGPSTPAKLVGLSGTPEAGATFMVCKNEREARDIANARAIDNRNKQLATSATESVEDLFSKINDAQATNLKLIIKSDVRGSGEAIADSLNKLPSDKIKIDVVMSGVGAITDNDVMLAAASDALIVGFHVRVNPGVNAIAKRSNVEIRLYSIIYELIEEIKDALTGLLAPVKREKDLGSAKILQIFDMRKGPKICGCMVDKGSIKVGAKARVIRNKELIFNGEINSLRRFTDDVKEVKAGLECGIRLDNFMDFVEGDIISVYDIEFEKDIL
jgi:translation initiation factor IF-2